MKNAIRIVSLLLALLLSSALLVACGTPEGEHPNPITITVEVVDDKGETETFTITTKSKTLRGALEQENLVEGEDGPYGLYIHKVNGLSAVYETDGAYWNIFVGDTAASTGVDGIETTDGGLYRLVYTKA